MPSSGSLPSSELSELVARTYLECYGGCWWWSV